jgi:hypothetical protein
MTTREFNAAWEARQAKFAVLRCVNGHVFIRRRSIHLGMWKTCRGCLLIEPLPTLTVVR